MCRNSCSAAPALWRFVLEMSSCAEVLSFERVFYVLKADAPRAASLFSMINV